MQVTTMHSGCARYHQPGETVMEMEATTPYSSLHATPMEHTHAPPRDRHQRTGRGSMEVQGRLGHAHGVVVVARAPC